ncbi:MAG: hypothetical protein ABIC04_03320 [Nanoarchaeota archaeon]
MANKSVIDWLQRYLKAGYDLNTLKKSLLDHGYLQSDIDEAVRVIYNTGEVNHIIHLSKSTIAVIVALIFTVLLIGGSLFYFLSPKAPAQLLDVRTELLTQTITPGDKLEFNIELTSLGSAARFDVDVRYDIETDGEKVIFKEETIGVETSKSYKTFFEIPEDVAPGDYILRTTVRYSGKIARAASNFRIREKSLICADGIKNNGEQGIDCGGPCLPCVSCADGIKNQGEVDIDCGGPCPACGTCFDSIKNQAEDGIDCGGPCSPCTVSETVCSDNDPCTKDEFIGQDCVYTPIEPCCGNNVCEEGETCESDCDDPFSGQSVWERLAQIEELAKSDHSQAAGLCESFENPLHLDKCYDNVGRSSGKDKYCDKISDVRTKEECYIVAAKANKDTAICAKIEKDTRKDRCLMHFATAGIDYSVCSEVSDYYLLQLCNSMKSLAESPKGPEE